MAYRRKERLLLLPLALICLGLAGCWNLNCFIQYTSPPRGPTASRPIAAIAGVSLGVLAAQGKASADGLFNVDINKPIGDQPEAALALAAIIVVASLALGLPVFGKLYRGGKDWNL
mmetsp:Transcript_136162/g.290920  ORF Transcript_136162/g.290920 Transcript_136162/m.290920 type:complete len:116 (+) Transcript_136162:105-452(+)